MRQSGSISYSGDAAHDAIDLAAGYLTGGAGPAERWDGLPQEVIELLSSQAQLSALLASTLMQSQGAEHPGPEGAALLERLRKNQPARGEVVPMSQWWWRP